MSTMAERLQEALDARQMLAADLVRRLDRSKGTVYNILNGQTQPEKVTAVVAAQICRALRIRPEWLLWDDGDMDPKPTASQEEDWGDVLGYAQAAGLGDGIEGQEYAETHKLKFRSSSLARKRLNPSKLAVIYGRGDSMLPRIHSGDAILFDQSDTRPRDEALFVVALDGAGQAEYSVKRCRYFGDMVFFDALNPEGDHNWRKPRRMDDERHPITIIGRVRWIGSWED